MECSGSNPLQLRPTSLNCGREQIAAKNDTSVSFEQLDMSFLVRASTFAPILDEFVENVLANEVSNKGLSKPHWLLL